MMDRKARIYIAGHNGMVGSALLRRLEEEGCGRLLCRSFSELDLRRQELVERFFAEEKPEYVFLAAAKVGGIHANSTYPAEFIYDNLMIAANIIHAAYVNNVKKLLFLGSSCIYPKLAPQPIQETHLFTGSLEETNEAYAMAKIAGLEMCKFYKRQYGCNFISVMPTNLYGINDNFDLETSHVLPALIRKFHEAKINNAPQVVIWGTGTPRREFLYVDDLADALVYLMDKYDGEQHVNVGTGEDIAIRELAEMIKDIVEYRGDIVYDAAKPDGTPRKLLDVSVMTKLGWRHTHPLRKGIEKVYTGYRKD